jgi:hypothetical protein
LTTSSKEGAVLLLPDGGSRYDFRPRLTFREYALKHAKSWYEFINGKLGRDVRNGSVYLVTGCDKAYSWGVASFSNASEGGQTSLKFSAEAEGGSTSNGWKWETSDSVSACSGPKRVAKTGTPVAAILHDREGKFSVQTRWNSPSRCMILSGKDIL